MICMGCLIEIPEKETCGRVIFPEHEPHNDIYVCIKCIVINETPIIH